MMTSGQLAQGCCQFAGGTRGVCHGDTVALGAKQEPPANDDLCVVLDEKDQCGRFRGH